jgi:fibronectin-binding autotransporter adhesin
MTFQPNQNLYGVAIGSTNGQGPSYPHYDVRAPASTDVNFFLGQKWVWPNNGIWFLIGLSSTGGTLTATWAEAVTSSGTVNSVTGTTNQITASPNTGAVTLSVPSTFVAPGSIASTTTITAGTGLTVTSGGETITAGNLTLSGTGSGFVLTPTVVAAGASPQTANGRVVQVTFSGVSIAAGSTQSFVINNTSVSAIGTVVDVSWFGATNGSALSIASIVNVAGTSTTITMTNGTGATTSVANITFVVEVLN